jgi:hypothetical protein
MLTPAVLRTHPALSARIWTRSGRWSRQDGSRRHYPVTATRQPRHRLARSGERAVGVAAAAGLGITALPGLDLVAGWAAGSVSTASVVAG